MKPGYSGYDPQTSGGQYLEDLATGYWYSDLLFTAVDLDLFTMLDDGRLTATDLADRLGLCPTAMGRFLQAACSLGLLIRSGDIYCNTKLSREYLVRGRPNYQGDSILWRKQLTSQWRDLSECLKAGARISYPETQKDELKERIVRYMRAMDNVARTKAGEIALIFDDLFEETGEGLILDAGAGSGAMALGFLQRFTGLKAVLTELPHVMPTTREMVLERGYADRVAFLESNMLEPWEIRECFDLVILSNTLHAYSERETPHILREATACLKPQGVLLIHDFFPEHRPDKAALFDLNMLVNTYNGKVFPAGWVEARLSQEGLATTGLVPLPSDTAVIMASRDPGVLARLNLEKAARLRTGLKNLGFKNIVPIDPCLVTVAQWPRLRCRYGCEHYGNPQCPPNSLTPGKIRAALSEFSQAFLMEGEPPTRDFQRRVLEAEGLASRSGYYKAFAFWAGPCSICGECSPGDKCRNPRLARPSMEGSGIDVFATVKQAGLKMKTLSERDDYVKYFALLLLE